MDNLDSTEDAGGGNPIVDSHRTETGNQRNDSNDNVEEEQDKEDNISPSEALKVIEKQKTHNLYCPKCTYNITENAEHFEIRNEPYNNQAFVLWVPLVFPSSFLSCFCRYWGGKYENVF